MITIDFSICLCKKNKTFTQSSGVDRQMEKYYKYKLFSIPSKLGAHYKAWLVQINVYIILLNSN